jgi:hypothetical protein
MYNHSKGKWLQSLGLQRVGVRAEDQGIDTLIHPPSPGASSQVLLGAGALLAGQLRLPLLLRHPLDDGPRRDLKVGIGQSSAGRTRALLQRQQRDAYKGHAASYPAHIIQHGVLVMSQSFSAWTNPSVHKGMRDRSACLHALLTTFSDIRTFFLLR